MAKTIHSGNLTFIDLTDSKKVDVHISSNLPTVQIYNANGMTATCSPDWTSTSLKLTLTAYADSTNITNILTNDDIVWYRQVGSGDYIEVQNGGIELQISSNELVDEAIGWSAGVISYICRIQYNSKTFENKITFARTDTGRDGTSVNILGKYNTLDELQAARPTGNAGDAYVINGHLYVWTADDLMWEDVGNIQGPKGEDAKSIVITGTSQVFKVGTSTTTPAKIAVTAKTINFTADIEWWYRTNNDTGFTTTVPDGVTVSDNKNLTITGQNLGNTVTFITCKATYGEIEDIFTVYKAIDGAKGDSASMAFLTNENVSFSARSNGTIPLTAASSFTTNVVSYNGVTKITPTIGAISDLPSGMAVIPNKGTAYSNVNATIENLTVDDLYTSSTFMTTVDKTELFNGDSFVVGNYLYVYNSANSNFKCQTIVDADGVEQLSEFVVNNEIMLTFSIAKDATLDSDLSNNGNITIPIITPVSTDLKLSWSKINSGAKGDKGDNGVDSYTVLLTNESHIFAGDVKNAIEGIAETQILAYKGSTTQTIRIDSVDGVPAGIIDTDTTIPGLKFICDTSSGTSPKITFKCTTDFEKANGTIPIRLTVDGISFTKIFTYSIAFKGTTGNPGNPGSPGTPASLVNITPSAHYFKSTTGKDGTFTPDYIYLYPRFQTVTYSKWEYSTNGGTSWTTVTSGSNGLTIGTYNSVANSLQIAKTSALYTDSVTSVSFRCVSSSASVYDTVSIAKIYDVVDLEIGGRNLLLNSRMPLSINSNNSNEYPITTELITEGTRQFRRIKRTSLTSNPNTLSLYNSITWNMLTDEIRGKTVTMSFAARASHEAQFTIAAGGYSPVTNLSGNPGQITIGTEWKRFAMTTTIPTDIDTGIRFCPLQSNAIEDLSTFYLDVCEWQIEFGNKATDWSPAPEDLNNITFEIYAPDGCLLTDKLSSLTLQTFPYEGSIKITSGAEFQWSQLIDNTWTDISDATGNTLTVTKADVLKAKSYRCVMEYKSKTYTSTITVQDKTDSYNSVMCISSNPTNNDYYWVLYTMVYSDTKEIDPLLGPISITAPSSPVSGDYWYAVDSANATVTLKKYNGTSWATSTDTQSLSYYWDIVDDGSTQKPLGDSAKVKVISRHDFTATATLVCEVSNLEDGLLTQSSLSLTDGSDPIISDTEPIATVNGQIWIKRNDNGTYLMFIWDESASSWISSDMDTRSKVHTDKPSSYNAGDLWITKTDTEYGGYYALATSYSDNVTYYTLSNESYVVASPQPTSEEQILATQYYRYVTYLQGTLLQAQTHNTTYDASDWSPTLKYEKDFYDIKDTITKLTQYVSITGSGLRIAAKDQNGKLSEFTSLFTSEALTFYQAAQPLLILANNKLTAPQVLVEDKLEVNKVFQLGDLQLLIESNGSFSFVIEK